MSKERIELSLTPQQVLEYIIIGIKNGKYQASIDLATDCIEQLNKTNNRIVPDE